MTAALMHLFSECIYWRSRMSSLILMSTKQPVSSYALVPRKHMLQKPTRRIVRAALFSRLRQGRR
jgi:hypothetical protein